MRRLASTPRPPAHDRACASPRRARRSPRSLRTPLPRAAALAPALVAFALVAASAGVALAHEVGLSRGVYRVDGGTISAEITFARAELRDLVPGLDADGDRALTDAELSAGPAMQAAVVDRVRLLGDGAACPGTFARAALVEEDGALVVASFRCPSPPRRLALELPLVDALPTGHRHLAQVVRGASDLADSLADWVLHRRDPRAELELTGDAAPATPPLRAYFLVGLEHILLGIDHLVFLLGLVLIGGRARSIVGVVTAFTLGHSLSLALVTLGVWNPSGAWVEPAIAASIIYIGVENFFVRDVGKRWRLTLPFGFVHGLGFAGGLAEVGVPGDAIVPALVLFNLGVEVGQLAVLLLVWPVFLGLGRVAAVRRLGVPVVSAAIALAGLAWFIERVMPD